MKSLKKFFISIFILIFSSVCLVNVTTIASSWDCLGDCIQRFPCFDCRPQKEPSMLLSLSLKNLCIRIAEKIGEAIPSEIEDQQLMVCKNLYLLFSDDLEKEPHYELQNVLFLLCENDQSLSWKIRPILDKCNYKNFCLLYQKFIDALSIDKSNKDLTKADALLLLSYMYLYGTEQLPEEIPIFNIYEKLDLIIMLKTIFYCTIYESILEIFHICN